MLELFSVHLFIIIFHNYKKIPFSQFDYPSICPFLYHFFLLIVLPFLLSSFSSHFCIPFFYSVLHSHFLPFFTVTASLISIILPFHTSLLLPNLFPSVFSHFSLVPFVPFLSILSTFFFLSSLNSSIFKSHSNISHSGVFITALHIFHFILFCFISTLWSPLPLGASHNSVSLSLSLSLSWSQPTPFFIIIPFSL